MRKSPRSLAARGLSVEWLGEACEAPLCSTEDILNANDKQAVCATCAFFKAVRLSARFRTFCMLSGQKLPPSTMACEFWPGIEFAEAVLP